MWFWWFMLICDLLTPIFMIFAGRMMWKYLQENVNGAVGYRTGRSMKNTDTWKFANIYCGKLWCKIGKVMFFPCMILHLLFYGSSVEIVGAVGGILCTMQVIVLLVSIFLTESALKRNFTKEGIRK